VGRGGLRATPFECLCAFCAVPANRASLAALGSVSAVFGILGRARADDVAIALSLDFVWALLAVGRDADAHIEVVFGLVFDKTGPGPRNANAFVTGSPNGVNDGFRHCGIASRSLRDGIERITDIPTKDRLWNKCKGIVWEVRLV
jgi:hypothetical protein